MNQSEYIEDLLAALVKAQGSFEEPKKTAKAVGTKFSYNYSPLENVRAAALPALTTNNLTVMQFPINDGDKVGVETILAHASGQYISRSFCTHLQKTDPQSVGSALTYYRRYGLLAVLGLAPEDDDAQSAMPEGGLHPSITNAVQQTKDVFEINPSDYQFKFGKFKGLKIDEIDKQELTNWAEWMVKNNKTDGHAKEALAAIKLFLQDAG